MGVKRLGREAVYSHLSSAEVKKDGSEFIIHNFLLDAIYTVQLSKPRNKHVHMKNFICSSVRYLLHDAFLLGLFSDHVDGGDMFHRNVA
jgi:hypothetical protein